MRHVDQTLDALAPADGWAPDWHEVLERSGATARPPRRLRRAALACAVLVVAIALPAIALSASLRGWLGLAPQPVFRQAHLVASVLVPGNRVARLWTSPSTTGGRCEFATITPANHVVIDPTTGALRPTTQVGGGSCTIQRATLPPVGFSWSFSAVPGASRTLGLLEGHFGGGKPAQVVLRWHGGRKRLAFADGFFLGVAEMREPSFRRLPFDVLALDATGRTISASRIPSSFLYAHWKHVQPSLRRYRQAHGCAVTPPWACRSR